ncbi:MAG: DNA (cytosine-5-)-methyltransferase [Clostridia bacterium]|nr:DNA (cytosine-5-)-methyltransferase [Clostridia bacterium]
MKEYEWYLKDLDKIEKNKYNVFTCFSCGGGSSMGYKLAGFNVIGNCEIDKKINDIYIKNHHPKFNYCMGIQEMNKLKEFPNELYNLDILDGSPPCSTFSIAGQREENWGKNKKFREGQASQILDDLFFEFIDLAAILKPKIIIAENVKGLIMGNAKGYVNMIVKKLDEIGYNVQMFLLNAANMGVPQKRERVFFIATRKEYEFPKLNLVFNEQPIKYGEFKDTEYKSINKDSMIYERWKKRSNRDCNLGDTVKRTENGKISSFNIQFLKDNRTPNTLPAGGSLPVRFDVPGYASDRDIKIIQTFPQDYDFCGSNVQYICGMSVPPLMMKKIAEQVKLQLLDKILK